MITYTLLSAFEEFERVIYVKFDGMSGRLTNEEWNTALTDVFAVVGNTFDVNENFEYLLFWQKLSWNFLKN